MRDIDRRLSVAPMMDWTDRHCRYFLRCISRHTLLYTEMVTAHAITRGDRDHLLGFDPAEHPLALQLGGSDPAMLRDAVQAAASYGYDEINLNVGCPSDRVRSGRFGACLMAEPDLVADCMRAIRDGLDAVGASQVPATVKTRIGIDEEDSYAFLDRFVRRVADAGVDTFIIHARKAWLKGLSPKENREKPPLHYERVHAIKRDHPQLEVVLNGGVMDIDQARRDSEGLDGAMVGRAAYHDPWMLSEADTHIFGAAAPAVRDRTEVVAAMRPYIQTHLDRGGRVADVSRHMLGLFLGQPGARRWRRTLSEGTHGRGAGVEILDQALSAVTAAAAA